MLSWLRRRFGWFERRWIRDLGERERSTRRVRSRLGLGIDLDGEREGPATTEQAAPAGTEPSGGR